ncbi:ImmA/IrrE family metallo-endopeptidase [Lactococcus fujiensis]|uniref:IrrE N-terminal-like domain-containing protein n=1 Tax=Lactococcus fujiensis JCM 16395 TaxID=1291764 RepID=A0A2A5RJ83_9LACT|nr:ImmA/IrrE family metallo-endopeptidase [Lactococcus fujiensis]PCR99199.1 hypothetical protein RT41_GL000390 [Lactococcus fujiensis JCM 16395]
MLETLKRFLREHHIILRYSSVLNEQGKFLKTHGINFIIIRSDLSELEEIKVIIHELEHFKSKDTSFQNDLQNLYSEARARENSIPDLISLLATEEIPNLNYVTIAEYLGINAEANKEIICEALAQYRYE